MTISDDYARIALADIVIPDDRQRSDLDLDEGFLASISARGIISPVLVRRDNTLVAGGRRCAAARALSLATVPVRYVNDDADDITCALIELEENVKRKELPWQDEARAIALLHRMYVERNASWSNAKTSEMLGIGPVHLWLRVAKALASAEESEKIVNAAGMRAAYNICARIDERLHDAVLEEIHSYSRETFSESGDAGDVDESGACVAEVPGAEVDSPTLGRGGGSGVVSTTMSAPPPTLQGPRIARDAGAPRDDILVGDFIAWAQTYSGPRFNFIHCDFPYGKRVNSGEQGGKRDEEAFKYNDDPSTYWALCEALAMNVERLATPTAHLMFWTSSEIANLHKTIEFFREHAPTFIFQPRALTWHKSDNVGIVPDPLRGPRWIVETALMASRGDRPLVKPLASSYSAPTARALHPSTKPEPVLRHFFGMFVDGTTRMLDPTCGSGSALRAAESLGAESVFGIERSEDFARSARKALNDFRNLRELTR